ncbi:MAG: hypothetical protein HYS41_07540 [Candidatus Omnitrophica bacterium]|nr:hypothetical protein [Candidatus Omnitrophota bacterium]
MKETISTIALAGLLLFASHPVTHADEILPTVDQMEKAYPTLSLPAYEAQRQKEKEELQRRKLVEMSMVRATAAAQGNLSQTLMEQKMERAVAGQAIKEQVEKAMVLGAAASQARKASQANRLLPGGAGQGIIRLGDGNMALIDANGNITSLPATGLFLDQEALKLINTHPRDLKNGTTTYVDADGTKVTVMIKLLAIGILWEDGYEIYDLSISVEKEFSDGSRSWSTTSMGYTYDKSGELIAVRGATYKGYSDPVHAAGYGGYAKHEFSILDKRPLLTASQINIRVGPFQDGVTTFLYGGIQYGYDRTGRLISVSASPIQLIRAKDERRFLAIYPPPSSYYQPPSLVKPLTIGTIQDTYQVVKGQVRLVHSRGEFVTTPPDGSKVVTKTQMNYTYDRRGRLIHVSGKSRTEETDATGFYKTVTDTSLLYRIIAGQARLVGIFSRSETTGLDYSRVSTKTHLRYEYDRKGRLVGASGDSVTESVDAYGSRSHTNVNDTYTIILGQARLVRRETITVTEPADDVLPPNRPIRPLPLEGVTLFVIPGPKTITTSALNYQYDENGMLVSVAADPTRTVTGDPFGFTRAETTAYETYQVINGRAKLIHKRMETLEEGISGAVSRTTEEISYTYDGNGRLVDVNAGPRVTEGEDGQGNTFTRTEQNAYILIRGQARILSTQSVTQWNYADGMKREIESHLRYDYLGPIDPIPVRGPVTQGESFPRRPRPLPPDGDIRLAPVGVPVRSVEEIKVRTWQPDGSALVSRSTVISFYGFLKNGYWGVVRRGYPPHLLN